jgi:hypothetical protein
MLKKLLARLRGKDGQVGTLTVPRAATPMNQIDRPDVRTIITAVRCNEMVKAKQLLRQWHIGLNRERLPGGECWIIGGYFFYFEFQWQLVAMLEDALSGAGQARVFVGRRPFWRVAVSELWEADKIDELRRRLPGVLQIYDPHVYLVWARILILDGCTREAGKYFLFSGMYDESETEFVAQYARMFAHAAPNEFIGQMPGPCLRKQARLGFPAKVYEDLARVNCPDWLKRRPAQGR